MLIKTYQNKDIKEFKRRTHSIKGVAQYIYSQKLEEIAKKTHQAADTQLIKQKEDPSYQISWTQIDSYYKEFLPVISEVHKRLIEILNLSV